MVLSGCSRGLDGQQARACRLAAVALADPAEIRVVGQNVLPPDPEGRPGVEVMAEGVDRAVPSRIDCRFPPQGTGLRDDLQAISTDAGTVSDTRLFLIKRYWLPSPEASAADPLAPGAGRELRLVPPAVAYAIQQGVAVLPNAAIYSLLAAAYSLVHGLNGRIILAFGDLAGIGGASALLGALLLASAGPPLLLAGAALLGLWAAGLHGAVIERLVLWPLRRSSGQQGLVATIGVALVLQETMRIASRSQSRWIGPMLNDPIALLRSPDYIVTVTPIALVLSGVALAASLALLSLLRWSRFGRDWRATADDALAASLFGIDPRGLALRTTMLACGLAGLAGAAVTMFYGSIGLGFTTLLGIKALVAAILGGLGSVPGAFLGGLAIATLEAGWSAYFPGVYRDVVVDGLLVIILMFRPGGFLGYRELTPRRV